MDIIFKITEKILDDDSTREQKAICCDLLILEGALRGLDGIGVNTDEKRNMLNSLKKDKLERAGIK